MKGLVSWARNGSANSSSQPGDVQWPKCQAILETHRKITQLHFPKPGLSPVTLPCSRPAEYRMLQENPCPHVGHTHSNTPKTALNDFSPSPQFVFNFNLKTPVPNYSTWKNIVSLVLYTQCSCWHLGWEFVPLPSGSPELGQKCVPECRNSSTFD